MGDTDFQVILRHNLGDAFWPSRGFMGFGLFLNSWISLISSAIDSLVCLVSLVTTPVYPSSEEVKDCYTAGGRALSIFPGFGEKGEWQSELSGRLCKLRKGEPSLFLWAERPFLMLVWGKVRLSFVCDFKHHFTYIHQTFRYTYFINLSKF